MSKYKITLDGKTYEMEVEKISESEAAERSEVFLPEETVRNEPQAIPATRKSAPVGGANTVNSPMPGTIVKVLTGEGAAVKRGNVVMVLEAMKMENEITAPRDGKIAVLHVKQGVAVQGGAPLFEIAE